MLNALSLVMLSACALLGAALAVATSLGLWRERGFGVPLIARAVRSAAIALLVGAVAVVLSFGRPTLFLSVLTNPNSGIFRVSIALVLALLLLVALHRALHHGSALPAFVRNLSTFAALATAAVVVFSGMVLFMPWRAGWHTSVIALPAAGWILPAAYTALTTLLILEARREGFENRTTVLDRTRTARLACASLLLPCLTSAILLARLGLGDAPAPDPTTARLLSGDLALPFWLGAALIGCALPALFLWLLQRRLPQEVLETPVSRSIALGIVALILECVGFAIFEWCILQLGSVTSWSFFR